MGKPLVDKSSLLEKFSGKSGCIYMALPEVLPDKNASFNWVKIKGSIEKAEIRKK